MDPNDGVPSFTLREIAMLKELSHINIVRLEEVVFGTEKVCLFLEFLEYDLKSYMDSMHPNRLDPNIVKSFMYELIFNFSISFKILS